MVYVNISATLDCWAAYCLFPSFFPHVTELHVPNTFLRVMPGHDIHPTHTWEQTCHSRGL